MRFFDVGRGPEWGGRRRFDGDTMALGVMRRHRRWLYVFLWIVILGFIAFYIPMFRTGVDAGSPGETLATVAGETITVAEFQKAYLRQRAFYERMYQGRMNPAMLRRMGLESQVLETLVGERLVVLEARRLGLSVDEDTLTRALTTLPEFQENGKFLGGEEIKRRLDYQGISPAEFEESLRARLLRDQLEALIAGSASVTPAEVEHEFRRRNEQVKVEYVDVPEAAFRAGVTATDDEVKARFEKARDRYKLPEQRVVSYVLVDQEALRARAAVTDADLEAYYQEHRDEFKDQEQVCASHVLVKVKASPEAKEGHPEAEAKGLAEAALAKIKGGADFAEIAKKSSEDTGSAERGGDLGCFPRGAMVPEFENVAFSLDPGQTSDLVRSSFGFHVIRVASRRDEQVQPLTAVKERIRPLVTADKTQKLAADQVSLAQGALKRGTLEEAAKSIGLTVTTSPAFSLATPPEPLNSPALAAKAFALKTGETERDGFPVGRGYVFFRVTEIKPSRAAELSEVQDKVKAEVIEEKALSKALEQAQTLRARAEAGGLDKAAAGLKLVRKETPALVGRGQPLGELGDGQAVEDAAFGLAEKALSAPVRSATGYAVLRVLEKKAFDPGAFSSQKAAVESSLLEQKRGQLFQAYMNDARERYAIERNPAALRRVLGQG
jgi:peptidyl-prolyl cis-trans isomerase D